jgi:hypothetical protein
MDDGGCALASGEASVDKWCGNEVVFIRVLGGHFGAMIDFFSSR